MRDVCNPISNVDRVSHVQWWMIRAGLILPWIDGLLVGVLPNAVDFVVDVDSAMGTCSKRWRPGADLAAYNVWLLLWQLVLPPVVFVYCYSAILVVIRRQSRRIAVVSRRLNVLSQRHTQSRDVSLSHKPLSLSRYIIAFDRLRYYVVGSIFIYCLSVNESNNHKNGLTK